MAWTVNNKANPYYAKKNHIRLAKQDMTKALINFSDGDPPVLQNNNGVITVTANGKPPPPILTNNNGVITAVPG